MQVLIKLVTKIVLCSDSHALKVEYNSIFYSPSCETSVYVFIIYYRPAQMKVLPICPRHIVYIPRNPEPFVKPGLSLNYILVFGKNQGGITKHCELVFCDFISITFLSFSTLMCQRRKYEQN